VIRW